MQGFLDFLGYGYGLDGWDGVQNITFYHVKYV